MDLGDDRFFKSEVFFGERRARGVAKKKIERPQDL